MTISLKGYKPLVVFGCVHLGHKDADINMAHRYVDWTKKHDAYALLLADNHECALPHKAHMMFDQDRTPQEQLDYGIELFRPIARQVIGACTGNHAGRANKVAGLYMDKIMSDRLGWAHCYFNWQGLISIRVGEIVYKIAFKHGSGQGSNTFGNCIQLSRAFPAADICAASHTHELATTKRGYWDFGVDGGKKLHEVTFINTASLLNYPRYADEAGYSPQAKGFAIAWLSPKEHHVHVDTSGKI